MVADCDGPWEALQALLRNHSQNIVDLIDTQMEWASEYLGMSTSNSWQLASSRYRANRAADDELSNVPAATTVLSRVLTARANLLTGEVEGHCEIFARELV